MSIIAPRTSIAQRPHRVLLQQPIGMPMPNGDGGVTQLWGDVPPPAFAQVSPATPGLLERVAVGTTSTTASHVVTMPWRPGVTTAMRLQLVFDARILMIVGVLDPDERHVDLVLACTETPGESPSWVQTGWIQL